MAGSYEDETDSTFRNRHNLLWFGKHWVRLVATVI